MKNNRLTNEDLRKLRMASERIRFLASLENAMFSSDAVKDEAVKKEIRPYMMWFSTMADSIDDLLDGKKQNIISLDKSPNPAAYALRQA